MISTVIAALCILIEIYHIVRYYMIKGTKETVNDAVKSLQKVDPTDYNAIREILESVPMCTLHKYFIMFGIELLYMFFTTLFIFLLPNGMGILVFGILMILSLISWRSEKFLTRHNKYIFDIIDSIICIIMYILILTM